MRIITGLLKGRKINISKSLQVRPTTDRVKEGIFSVIEAYRYIPHSIVLDLFAGSGNLGFEAISRGAKQVRFVDYSRPNTDHIKKQADQFDVEAQSTVVKMDVKYFLKGLATPADLIFCDPPYKYQHLDEIVDLVLSNNWLNTDGWLVVEHNKYYDFSEHTHCMQVKKYGRTYVSFFNESAVDQ